MFVLICKMLYICTVNTLLIYKIIYKSNICIKHKKINLCVFYIKENNRKLKPFKIMILKLTFLHNKKVSLFKSYVRSL